MRSQAFAATVASQPIAYMMTAAIATILPRGPWTADRDEDREAWATLTRADGATVWLEWARPIVRRGGTYRSGPGRINVSGRYPRHGGFEYAPRERPRISMDEAKPVERLAAEIDRRFLSAYLPAWADGLARFEQREAAQVHARRVAERLAIAAGPGAKLNSHDRYSETEWSVWTESGTLRVTASEPDSANVSARLSIGAETTAMRVARALRSA